MKTFTIRDTARKGIEMMKGSEMSLLGVPVGQGLAKDMEHVPGGRLLLLHNLDVSEGPDGNPERLLREANGRYRRALILVETTAGDGGKVGLFANTICERYDQHKKRVVREANPIESAAGVCVLAAEEPEVGDGPFLVVMQPGASFRIVRTGVVGASPPELVVLWNGRWNERDALDEDLRCDMLLWGLTVFNRKLRHGDV